MQRILEPELMQDPTQVKAYADADFTIAHNQFIELIAKQQGPKLSGNVLDLGCGPGDITIRFAQKFKACQIDAVDGAENMLTYARQNLPEDLQQRVRFILGYLPDTVFSTVKYQTIISNSLLHHLPDPNVLWQTIKHYAQAGAQVFIMDLLRPEHRHLASQMRQTYAANEPEILQTDFYNSLLAAFTLDEINMQLKAAKLTFSVKQVSDRHVFINGTV